MGNKDRGRPTWVRFSGIGVEFAGVIGALLYIGWKIDRHYDSGPWGVVIGASLGLIGGMYNLIRESLKASKDAAAEESNRHSGESRNQP